MSQYEVELYEDEDGNSQIKTWLYELQRKQPKVRAKVARMFEKLESLGYELKMPHCKHVQGPIWELRNPDGIRVYYFRAGKQVFVAAAGEVKKEDDADSALLQYALKAHKEYSQGNYDEKKAD